MDPEVAQELDAGLGLSEELYAQLLGIARALQEGNAAAQQAAQQQLDQLNAGAAAAAPRAVLLAAAAPATLPSLIEEHLIAAGRRGVLVLDLAPEEEEGSQRKRRRAAGHVLAQAGARYECGGHSGRVNFLPSGRQAVPLVGKRSKGWSRTLAGTVTHQGTAWELRRVLPNPAPAALRVTGAIIHGSTTELQTHAQHPFHGGGQMLTLQGAGEAADGNYPVWAAGTGSNAVKSKLPRPTVEAIQKCLQQPVEQQQMTVREAHVLDSAITLHHFMVAEQPQQPPQQPQQQPQQPQPPPQQQQLAPVPTGELDWFMGVFPDMPELDGGLADQLQFHDGGGGLLGADAGQMLGGGLAALPLPPGAGLQPPGPAGLPPPPPPSGGIPGAAAAPEHAQQEGHYLLLTVGGQQPLTGREPYAGQALVVQGRAEVTGDLTVQGLNVVSDARAKENVRVLDEAVRSVEIASEISICIFKYKDSTAEQLGVLAQQTREVLERYGAAHLNIVKEDGQGRLVVDYSGLQALTLGVLQQVVRDVRELKAAAGSTQLSAMGGLQQLAARQLDAPGASSSSSALSASSSLTSLGSLVVLADDGDVEVSGSSEEEAADQAAAAEGEFAGLGDEAVVQLLMERLQEHEAHVRKLLGTFVGSLSRAALWQVFGQTLGQPTGLISDGSRARALGGAFIKNAKKRVQEEKLRGEVEAQSVGDVVMRGYQERVAAAARQGGNLIVVAPTGAGKTLPMVVHTAYVLQRDATARCIFLAPTQALALQQAAAFLTYPAFSSGAFKVDCRTGDNPVAPRDWPEVLQESHVLVMTPQLLLNMLETGAAHFFQIALLVLDECHHTKDSHPTSKILEHYRRSDRKTQLIGLTASPASRDTAVATFHALHRLRDNLDAEYLVLDRRDDELMEAVPSIEEREILVELARQDADCASFLGGFAADAAQRLQPLLPAAAPALPAEVLDMLRAGRWTNTAARWTVTAADALREAASTSASLAGGHEAPLPLPLHDATNALLLVRAAVAALALVSDVGLEAGLRHLSQEFCAVAAKLVGSGAGDASTRQLPFTTRLVAQLAGEVEAAGVLAGAFGANAARDAGGGHLLSRHPKFRALTELLLEYRDRPTFHGILFARTREDVRSLARQLRAVPDLHFLQVHELMGHGNRRGGGGDMTSKAQQAVIEQFKEAGCRLLISTAAGEEGIDVPRCEFVVRYSAVQTGRERLQSAGRARKHGSLFVEIIEDAPEERAQVRKARAEVAHLNAALAGLAVASRQL